MTLRVALPALTTLLLCAIAVSWLVLRAVPPPAEGAPPLVPAVASAEPVRAEPADLRPVESEGTAVEPDVAAPAATTTARQTFEQYLADRLERALSEDADGMSPFGMPSPWWGSAEQVAREKRFNPERKELKSEQLEALSELLREQRERDAELQRENRALTRAAVLQAVRDSRFVVREQPPIAAANATELARQANLAMAEGQRAQSEMLAELTTLYGEPLRDWAYSACATSEPDGVSRQTVVYFTRPDAPEVFACRDRWSAAHKENDLMLRQFFARLP